MEQGCESGTDPCLWMPRVDYGIFCEIHHISCFVYNTQRQSGSLSERQTWEIAYQYWRDEGIFKFHITREKLVELRLCYTTVTICEF